MWSIHRTDTFAKYLRKQKSNRSLFQELEKKLMSLKENPLAVGGELSGKLHGKRSTRVSKNFRLIFSVDKEKKKVYLEALDHRKDIYS